MLASKATVSKDGKAYKKAINWLNKVRFATAIVKVVNSLSLSFETSPIPFFFADV